MDDLTQKVLRPRLGSRTINIGTTGSGKSVLGKAMLETLSDQHIVIIDPKGEFEFAGGKVFKTPMALASQSWRDQARVRIYRPGPEHLQNLDSWEQVFSWVFRRKNTVLYIDELFAVCRGAQTAPPSLISIYTQGRSLNITVIACVQRPANVPVVCISESGRVALFEVAMRGDRERVAECTTEALKQNVAEIEGFNGHYFWWYERGPNARPYVLYYPLQKGGKTK